MICFHCGEDAVIWSGDFDFSDYCMEGSGIVHELHCMSCGAEIVYYVNDGSEDEDDA